MLLKITNYCSLGCSHCMEDSTVKGAHMTYETFVGAIDLTRRLEKRAWNGGLIPTLLFSGGECTEHPNIIPYLEAALRLGFVVVLITNGQWLADKNMRKDILRPEWRQLRVAVTHNERFYPNQPPARIDDKRISYREEISLIRLGRAARKAVDKLTPAQALLKYPASFNLRSACRAFGNIEDAITFLRLRSVTHGAGACTPSISSDGSVHAGDSTNCFKIGDIHSTAEELTKALIDMQCNACGLEDNLNLKQRRAIGLSTLYASDESDE